MAVSKSDARRLTKDATEIGGHVLRGVVKAGPEGITVGDTDLLEWLQQFNNSEVMLVGMRVEAGHIESDLKICYTCGRDYRGDTCPYCAEARARLRGM
jgi:hypothetical protein